MGGTLFWVKIFEIRADGCTTCSVTSKFIPPKQDISWEISEYDARLSARWYAFKTGWELTSALCRKVEFKLFWFSSLFNTKPSCNISLDSFWTIALASCLIMLSSFQDIELWLCDCIKFFTSQFMLSQENSILKMSINVWKPLGFLKRTPLSDHCSLDFNWFISCQYSSGFLITRGAA